MNCQLCKKKSASVRVTYGYYKSRTIQTLALCSECSQELWDGHKIRSLKNPVTAGIAYYIIKGINDK